MGEKLLWKYDFVFNPWSNIFPFKTPVPLEDSMRLPSINIDCVFDLGYSRAATIVAAYMMLKKNYTATQVRLYASFLEASYSAK